MFTGLEQLCKTDSSFEPFQQTLFSQAGSETNRDAQTKHENEVLDASLEAYLKLLTDHFLSAPAFQTLEYLVRRYRYVVPVPGILPRLILRSWFISMTNIVFRAAGSMSLMWMP